MFERSSGLLSACAQGRGNYRESQGAGTAGAEQVGTVNVLYFAIYLCCCSECMVKRDEVRKAKERCEGLLQGSLWDLMQSHTEVTPVPV